MPLPPPPLMDIIPDHELPKRSWDSPVITIGNFDGVHLGHRAIVERVVARAREGGSEAVALTFESPADGEAEIAIFDVHGRRVRRLAVGAATGQGRVIWDGRNDDGRPVTSGTYWWTVTGETDPTAAPIVLVK